MEGAAGPSCGNHQPRLPPGFRFHPTDEELVVHYLKKKAASAPLPVAIIAEIDLYKYDPWELPNLMLFLGKASFGEQEWYFFSPRERKYPNGERPNRAATSGYWKATGTDKPIMAANRAEKIGVKKALVFYGGKPPKGIKTSWIMHEYRLVGNNSTTNKPPGINLAKKSSLRLDDWVLCRIFKKSSSSSCSMETASMDGYQSPIPGSGKYSDGGNNYFPVNESAVPENTVSIPPLASSSLDGMATNGTIFSSKEWEGNEDNFNPSCSSSDYRNISFISLLNQQYTETFHQNSLVNPPGDGILRQTYRLPNSHFQ